MKFTYTITRVDPSNKFMSVRYSSDGYPDVFQNFNPEIFTKDHLVELIQNRASIVSSIWELIDKDATSEVVDGETGTLDLPIKPIQMVPPEFNALIEKLEPYEETIDGVLNLKWRVVQLTLSEKSSKINDALTSYVKDRLDDFAYTRGYDDIVSVCTYANSTVEQYAIEAHRCVELRSQMWVVLQQIINDIDAEVLPAPDNIQELLPLFPELTWGD